MESEIKLQTHAINLMHIMTGTLPQNAVDEINKNFPGAWAVSAALFSADSGNNKIS